MVPIQVRSQFLRRWQPACPEGSLGPFAAMPADEAGAQPEEGEVPLRGHWRQRDVKRAIEAAAQAGLASYRVEVAPDGTISIIVGDPSDTGG